MIVADETLSFHDEFENSFVDRIDLAVIYGLLNTISGFYEKKQPCKLSRFQQIVAGNTRFIDKQDNSGLNTNVGYPRIRDCADFLGVPPWILFPGEGNEQIRELFKMKSAVLPFFEVKSRNDQQVLKKLNDLRIWEHKNRSILDDDEFTRKYFKEWEKTKANCTTNFFPFKNERFDRVSANLDTFIELLNVSMTIDYPFKYGGSLRFYSRKYESWRTGNFRVSQGLLKSHQNSNDKNEVQMWRASWFSIQIRKEEKEGYLNDVENVRDELTYIFGINPLRVYVYHEEYLTILYSWHNLRIMLPEKNDDIVLLITKKLENADERHITLQQLNYFSNSNEIYSDVLVSTEKNKTKDELLFLNWISKDRTKFIETKKDKNNIKNKYIRETNSISLLYNSSYLQIGDRLVLKFHIPTGTVQSEDPLFYGVFEIVSGEPRIKWDFDNNYYSISGLAKKILIDHLGLPMTDTHINGNKYFGKINSKESLLDIARKYRHLYVNF